MEVARLLLDTDVDSNLANSYSRTARMEAAAMWRLRVCCWMPMPTATCSQQLRSHCPESGICWRPPSSKAVAAGVQHRQELNQHIQLQPIALEGSGLSLKGLLACLAASGPESFRDSGVEAARHSKSKAPTESLAWFAHAIQAKAVRLRHFCRVFCPSGFANGTRVGPAVILFHDITDANRRAGHGLHQRLRDRGSS